MLAAQQAREERDDALPQSSHALAEGAKARANPFAESAGGIAELFELTQVLVRGSRDRFASLAERIELGTRNEIDVFDFACRRKHLEATQHLSATTDASRLGTALPRALGGTHLMLRRGRCDVVSFVYCVIGSLSIRRILIFILIKVGQVILMAVMHSRIRNLFDLFLILIELIDGRVGTIILFVLGDLLVGLVKILVIPEAIFIERILVAEGTAHALRMRGSPLLGIVRTRTHHVENAQHCRNRRLVVVGARRARRETLIYR